MNSKNSGHAAASLLIGLCSAVIFADVATASVRDKDQNASRVSNKMLAALVEVNGVPGMGASVWRDGKIVWSGSAGYRNVENKLPVNNKTIFRLASVSKLLTATAAARLEQEHKLDIDTPVSEILPYLNTEWAPVTTRQLAAHTSGIPHYQAVDQGRGGIHYASTHDAVGIFKDRQLLFKPGEKYSYSSWGYTLLSAVVEQRAEMPFLDYLATHVTPGLDIGPDATGSNNPNASIAYEFVDGKVQIAAAHDFSYTWAGGGLGATPDSLATFGGRLLQGKIISPKTFDWMLQPAKLNDGNDVADEDYRIGFGWRSGTDVDGRAIAHHAGVTTGARSALVLWPKQSTAVALLSNALWVSSIEQTAMMLAAPFKPSPENLVKTSCPTDSKHYQGTLGDRSFSGSVKFDLVDGICEGEISLDKTMQEYFNAFPQKDAKALRIISIDSNAGLARAALITPIGIYDLRANAQGMHIARFSSSKKFELRFE
ncbi:MAG: serine hydrolase domain-containing protein [Arenimonas sp.]